ncbi:HAMP domain-containing histidine kinase [Yokenella regensburgei]|uniref:sensor histidine kinase n=1 Tax=Yokenella regensburgei TaxID=158877 RepID=UPI003F141F32
MKLLKPLSLASKMAMSIISLQLITLYLTIGYFILDAMRTNNLTFGGVIPDSQVQLILDAVAYNERKELFIRATPQVATLLEDADAWIVVSDDKGQVIHSGNVPEVYERLTENINALGMSEVKATKENSQLSMKLLTKNIGKRTIRVLVGGIPTYKAFDIFSLLASVLSLKIFLPMGIAAVIFIPFITRKMLSGLSNAASDAKHINESDRKARIREDGIPSEVMPLVKAVNGALQRLSDGYDERDRFLSSAAHELRAPIAIIEARLSILTDTKARRILGNDVARLSNLAESLLDLQRIGRELSTFIVVDLKHMLRQVISDYSPMIIASGYDIEFISCKCTVSVRGDEASLSRAVINILQNAVIYGGGKGLISVELSEDGYIIIQDEGPGIALAERERIFEPFQRVIPQSQGTGLGLHLVKEIVHMHKGSVSAGEGKSGGALFEIYLPVLGNQ